MRAMREAILLAAVIGMTVTGSMSSCAVIETAATTVSYTETNLADGGGADSVITGHIKIINISVKAPIASGFDINLNVKIRANDSVITQTGGQVDDHTTTNLSTAPLEISITAVAPGAGVNLVDTVSGLDSADRSVLFTIREAKETPPALLGAKSNKIWMNKIDIEKGAPYCAKDNKTYTVGATDVSAIPSEETRTDVLRMRVYAVTICDWRSGNSFTIAPAFTVSLRTEAQTS